MLPREGTSEFRRAFSHARCTRLEPAVNQPGTMPGMNCSHCGRSIADDAAFCAYCGRAVPKRVDTPEKELTRPRACRLIGGVAAGMARHFGLPVIALRVGFVVLSILTVGLVTALYAVLWAMIPEEKE